MDKFSPSGCEFSIQECRVALQQFEVEGRRNRQNEAILRGTVTGEHEGKTVLPRIWS